MLSYVSKSLPFDNTTDGFTAQNAQDAIEEALNSSGGFLPTTTSGLVVKYKSGRAWVNGSLYIVTAGTITVGASLTNNFVYLSIAGTVSSGASVPSNAVPIAQFTSNASVITVLTDIRASIDNNVQFGTAGDVAANAVGLAAAAGTTNRFSDAGHVHPTTLTPFEVSATGSVNAPSGTDALMTGMTNTPVAGTYLIWFSCDLNSGSAGAIVSISIYVGGVQKADSLRKIMPFTGGTLTTGSQRVGASTNGLVTVNGSQAIEIRWSTSSGTVSTAPRTMNGLRTA